MSGGVADAALLRRSLDAVAESLFQSRTV